ncbi:MAG: twitching motility protein PilT [Sphaerobacter sp.]|nr:twitching motility protein PilT [Sphaerobacter sp.]
MSDRRGRAQRANSTPGRILRYLGLLLGIVVGWQLGTRLRPEGPVADYYGMPVLFAAAVGAILFLAAPYITLGFFAWLRREIRGLPAIDLAAAGLGLLVGGLLSSLLAWPISLLPRPWGEVLPFLAAVLICSLAVVACVTKKREIFGILGRRVGTSDKVASVIERPRMLLDTSAIIDGRVAELARLGFIRDELVVPHFVLRELQLVADAPDAPRRVRGRRGLDMLERMRRDERVRLEVSDLDVPEELDVDSKLVKLASVYGFTILTGDQNLERIAVLHGVSVLNLHALARAMRPTIVAGEEIPIKIIQPGREYGQGVGFLEDGTMVVVEEGKGYIGQDVTVVVTRTLQTGAGRMAFAQLKPVETTS